MGGAPITAQLRECTDCGHRFFPERYNETEMARLYGEYRGERYLRVRQAWEPWYTRRVNEQNLQAGVVQSRQQALRELLQRAGIEKDKATCWWMWGVMRVSSSRRICVSRPMCWRPVIASPWRGSNASASWMHCPDLRMGVVPVT